MATKKDNQPDASELETKNPETPPKADEPPQGDSTPPDETPPADETPAAPEPAPIIRPKKLKSISDLVQAVIPHVPPNFRAELTEQIEKRYADLAALKAVRTDEDISIRRHFLTSTVNDAVRRHALNLHAQALSNIVRGDGGPFDVYGIDLRGLYPECAVDFAAALRRALSAANLRSIRDIGHRSAPSHLTVVFKNIIRTDTYGIDGYAFETVLKEYEE